ncbi:MAG TPA: type I DNA topoisomerase [Acetobacteraceae bacterium]|nr:type I DNA topoisomerase [Acetobacteraceae bacterium]
MSDVVVVESPAKAKTINGYLGGGYTVLASLGHVRDLPPKDGSVRPDQDFAMDWQSDARGEKQVGAIAKALKGAGTLYLATDPDREGEAISWHVRAMLAEKKALKGIKVRRITFNEITRNAVRAAMAQPRDLDQPLIEAYLARRALDYLVGFTLSPVLWRKLPGSRSAGRVQSVALRLVCEREAEIELFRAREYWTVEADLATPAGAPFSARLTHLEGKRLEQFDLPNEQMAMQAKRAVEAGQFRVASVEKKRVRRNPYAPFTTSTLQQEASRKLGLGAQQTMRLAQQLYEGVAIDGDTTGLITYMRTDGVQMAREAIAAIRDHVGAVYGNNYLPAAPREYQTRVKNAQEAHEAIRPTDVSRTPDSIARFVSADQRRLYELIWKRAVASQMQSAELDQVSVEVTDGKGTTLRATGSTIAFDGFLKLYREDTDDAAEEDESRMLPPMAERDPLRLGDVTATQHFTQPPPRYSEASLVKKLEELGIGRPSTYASILSVLQDRKYVRQEKRRFIPEDRGRLVTAFLVSFFEHYVDTGFTASMEEKLDEIAEGSVEWRAMLRAFWDEFSHAVDQTKDLKISDVIAALDEDLGPHFFPPRGDGSDPRACPACGTGRLGLKLGRYGSFIGCSNYPNCQYTRRLAIETGDDQGETLKEGMRVLGPDPATGEEITVRRGPYGLYVQQGENGEDKSRKAPKPRRSALPRGMDGEQLTLEQAIGLLSLPRDVGRHPETGEMIQVGIGRFGPYVRMGAIYGSLDRDDDVLSIGINRAVDLIARKMASVRTLGTHPANKELVAVRKGRFGPYVQHGKMVANLPRGVLMEDVTLDQAVALLAEKGKQLRPRGAGRRSRGAAAAKPEPSDAPTAEPVTAAARKPAVPRKQAPRKKAPGTKTQAAAAKRRATPPKRAASKTTAKAPRKKKATARARKPAAPRR